MKNKKICILGGGLSGLSTAWKKMRQGHEITLIESSPRLGGVLQSEQRNGYLLDYGANTLSLRNQETSDILEDMGVLKYALDANPNANKRFIVRNQKLVSLPLNFSSFLSSSFLSPLGKLRLLLEPFIQRGNHDGMETVASFISRRLGKEALDYCGNPFISGIYASDPETLNLANAFPALSRMEKQYRSLLVGMFKEKSSKKKPPKTRLLSFPEGMNQLAYHIQKNLPQDQLYTNESVTSVTNFGQGWKVKSHNQAGNISEFLCDEVISTIPVDQISNIIWDNLKGQEHLSNLMEVTHFPLSMVFFGIGREEISHNLDGFGFLVPEKEKLSILGTLFSSTLFENRAPHGKVLLTTFVGGERMPKLALAQDEQIYKAVEKDLSKLIGMKKEPSFKHIKRWKQSIPLPDKKMNLRIKASKELSFLNNGLYFSGSALSGVSLPNCIEADIA
ncbi:MAG: protoporphyrinogen oxidase [Opitutales bacterium]|nr:protoporphyrinogen oxidase [Opitutales bacterium]